MAANEIESHWGAAAVDTESWDLPALKASFLIGHAPTRGRVCEIGSGDGKLLRTLKRAQPALELHGCDVRVPATKPEVYAFRQIQGDALPYDDAWLDGAIVFDVLEHVPDPERTLSEVARVLKPGGSFVAFVPTEGQPFSWYEVYRRLLGRDVYAQTKEHVHAFSRDGLRAMVERDFEIETTAYVYHALGHMMDASFFAAAKLKPVQRFWWNDNIYYNGPAVGSRPSLTSRALNGLMQLGNAAAYAESKLLKSVPFASAGIMFAARVRR